MSRAKTKRKNAMKRKKRKRVSRNDNFIEFMDSFLDGLVKKFSIPMDFLKFLMGATNGK